MNKKLVFSLLFLLVILLSIKQTSSIPPYELSLQYFDQFGDFKGSFYSGEVMYVSVQVNENNVPVAGKEVYLFFEHAGTGEWVTIGNIGTTDAQGRVYVALPVDSWFINPYCDLYRGYAKVWENGQFVPKEEWSSLYIYPTGCPPPSGGGGGAGGPGGSPIFKKQEVTELVTVELTEIKK